VPKLGPTCLSVLVLKIESQHYISNAWKQGPKNDKLLLLEKPCAYRSVCSAQEGKNNAIIPWPLE